MITIHPRTWFPLVLISLTLALLLAVVFSFNSNSANQTVLEVTEPQVTAVDYKVEIEPIVNNLLLNVEQASDDLERINILKQVQDQLLAVLVPAEYREAHLEIVIALNLMRQGYLLQDEDQLTEGRARFEQIITSDHWLN
ncbi:MAG: hypothetical protein V1695_00150 [Candidatus Uhrbacteria bacterium]